MDCYCSSGNTYDTCCEPILLGKAKAQRAEQLMRSRYSAFAIADINYLLNSHHPSTRPTKERKQILKWAKSVEWVRLEIISTKQGQVDDTEGKVEFKAFYKESGLLQCIHEDSIFVYENNQWFYKSGTHI